MDWYWRRGRKLADTLQITPNLFFIAEVKCDGTVVTPGTGGLQRVILRTLEIEPQERPCGSPATMRHQTLFLFKEKRNEDQFFPDMLLCLRCKIGKRPEGVTYLAISNEHMREEKHDRTDQQRAGWTGRF